MKTFSADLSLGEFAVHVMTNHSQLLDHLTAGWTFPPAVANDPPRATFNVEARVVDNLNHYVSLREDFSYNYQHVTEILNLDYLQGAVRVEVHYRSARVSATVEKRALHCAAALSNWIITLPVAELLKAYGLFFVHAAAVNKHGNGMLLAGKSGAGKTTIALGLLLQGWQLLSDDEVYLSEENGFQVRGGATKIKISFRTWDMFREKLGAVQPFRMKRLLDLNGYFPGQHIAKSNVTALCFLQRGPDYDLQRLPPIEALKELFNLAFLNAHPEYARQNFAMLGRFVNTVPCYRLRFSADFSAVDRLLTAIAEGTD